MKSFKQLAIIGPTASGKTALAIAVAKQRNALILSLDSLAIYKEIDIVSAKPDKEERAGIHHYGIDLLYPDEPFDVTTFIDLYRNVRQTCKKEGKNLIIVGGTGFYLKILFEGVSKLPSLSEGQQAEVMLQMQNPKNVYERLISADPDYMCHISPGDTYRIQKALEVYLASGEIPSTYFMRNPPQPIIEEPLPLYEILWERDVLRKRRSPNCMKAIGIKETLAYLDGIYSKSVLEEKITINTGRLAKRQETFNRSQFKDVVRGELETIKQKLLEEVDK